VTEQPSEPQRVSEFAVHRQLREGLPDLVRRGKVNAEGLSSVTVDVRLQFYAGAKPWAAVSVLDPETKKIALALPLSKPADVAELIRRLVDQAFEIAET
jgi:hypothetical protein